jgi:hypothetical protein
MPFLRTVQNYRRLVSRSISGVPIRPWQHQYEAIFIHIPKCAGTSILELFGHTGARDHGRWLDYQRANRNCFADYFKFSFTRSPVERLHSTYHYLRQGGNGGRRDRALSNQIGVNRYDFHDFVFTQITPVLIRQEVLFWEQSNFIFDQKDNLMVDFLGRVETLNESLEVILERLQISPQKAVSHLNRSQDSALVLTPEITGRVNQLYSRDTRLLGYA